VNWTILLSSPLPCRIERESFLFNIFCQNPYHVETVIIETEIINTKPIRTRDAPLITTKSPLCLETFIITNTGAMHPRAEHETAAVYSEDTASHGPSRVIVRPQLRFLKIVAASLGRRDEGDLENCPMTPQTTYGRVIGNDLSANVKRGGWAQPLDAPITFV